MKPVLFLAVFAMAVGRGGCDPATPYEPCAGKACGDACTLCAPDDHDCAETMVLKGCDPDGACVTAGTFTCEPPPYEPCAGKGCGDACTLCAPDDAHCVEAAVLKACDPAGRCVIDGSFVCQVTREPCAAKACGEPCSTCDPAVGLCPAVMEYCDAAGICGIAYPDCGSGGVTITTR